MSGITEEMLMAEAKADARRHDPQVVYDLCLSPQIHELAAAMAKAQEALTGASKNAVNPHFNSRYADLASVWDAAAPLHLHGLSVIQGASAEGPVVAITTLLLHASGQWIASKLTLVARDASPQAIGSAVTYGRRYGLAAMVGVAPEDDDAEAAQPAQHAPTRHVEALEPAPAAGVVPGAVAPAGYVYIRAYQCRNGWHEVAMDDASGGHLILSTKLAVGLRAKEAYLKGLPVKIEWKPKPDGRGGYLNGVEVWTPPAEEAASDAPF